MGREHVGDFSTEASVPQVSLNPIVSIRSCFHVLHRRNHRFYCCSHGRVKAIELQVWKSWTYAAKGGAKYFGCDPVAGYEAPQPLPGFGVSL